MRLIVSIVLFILLAAGLYTAYGVITFEPAKPAPLVFKEPAPETLKALGIYADTKEAPGPALTEAQQAQTADAVKKISDAMTIYQDYTTRATPRLKTTIALLSAAIGSGKLPAYFLSLKDESHAARVFETLRLDPNSVLAIESPQTSLKCVKGTSSSTGVLIGDDGPNTLACAENDPTTGIDQIFLGGPGNDTIVDNSGNRIVNAGSGNDTITLGAGRSIVVLEDGWGQDSLNVDCKGAAIAQNEIPANFPVPWVSKFTNFIVLSPRIQADVVKWNGNVLTNTSTGDTLTVNENCFTLISAQ